MTARLEAVHLDLVYRAIDATPGAEIVNWSARRPDYGEDSHFLVDAFVRVPNEYALAQLKGNYNNLLYRSARKV